MHIAPCRLLPLLAALAATACSAFVGGEGEGTRTAAGYCVNGNCQCGTTLHSECYAQDPDSFCVSKSCVGADQVEFSQGRAESPRADDIVVHPVVAETHPGLEPVAEYRFPAGASEAVAKAAYVKAVSKLFAERVLAKEGTALERFRQALALEATRGQTEAQMAAHAKNWAAIYAKILDTEERLKPLARIQAAFAGDNSLATCAKNLVGSNWESSAYLGPCANLYKQALQPLKQLNATYGFLEQSSLEALEKVADLAEAFAANGGWGFDQAARGKIWSLPIEMMIAHKAVAEPAMAAAAVHSHLHMPIKVERADGQSGYSPSGPRYISATLGEFAMYASGLRENSWGANLSHFTKAVHEALSQMSANNGAFAEELEAGFPVERAAELAPLFEQSGLLAIYPGYKGLHEGLLASDAASTRWQSHTTTALTAGCVGGTVAAIAIGALSGSTLAGPAAIGAIAVCGVATLDGAMEAGRAQRLAAVAHSQTYVGFDAFSAAYARETQSNADYLTYLALADILMLPLDAPDAARLAGEIDAAKLASRAADLYRTSLAAFNSGKLRRVENVARAVRGAFGAPVPAIRRTLAAAADWLWEPRFIVNGVCVLEAEVGATSAALTAPSSTGVGRATFAIRRRRCPPRVQEAGEGIAALLRQMSEWNPPRGQNAIGELRREYSNNISGLGYGSPRMVNAMEEFIGTLQNTFVGLYHRGLHDVRKRLHDDGLLTEEVRAVFERLAAEHQQWLAQETAYVFQRQVKAARVYYERALEVERKVRANPPITEEDLLNRILVDPPNRRGTQPSWGGNPKFVHIPDAVAAHNGGGILDWQRTYPDTPAAWRNDAEEWVLDFAAERKIDEGGFVFDGQNNSLLWKEGKPHPLEADMVRDAKFEEIGAPGAGPGPAAPGADRSDGLYVKMQRTANQRFFRSEYTPTQSVEVLQLGDQWEVFLEEISRGLAVKRTAPVTVPRREVAESIVRLATGYPGRVGSQPTFSRLAAWWKSSVQQY